MVCLGPRKKEKKNLSPDEAAARGLKKPTKLKKPSTLPTATATSAAAKKQPRTSLLEPKTIPRPPSRNSLLSTGRTPSPVHRPTSPHKPPSSRPTSMASVKSTASRVNNTTTTTASGRPLSNVSNTKRFPITEMKEEVKGLKAKVCLHIMYTTHTHTHTYFFFFSQNEENLKLIADQKAELELLKQQLTVSHDRPAHQQQQDEEELKKQEEQLLLREQEIEELRIKLEQQQIPSIVIQQDEHKAEILAQKEKLLLEKEAELEEQKRLIDEKVPHIDQVASQLEALKIQVKYIY